MKKLILIIAAACLCLGAKAQMYVGAKAGISGSWIPGTVIIGDETVVPHIGFIGGVSAGYDFGELFSVETGLYFTNKGHSDRRLEVGKYDRDLQYLILPLMGGVKFYDEKLTLLFGPQFGYLVASNVKEGDIKIKSMEGCNRFNIGLAAELHYMFMDSLGVNVRVDSGLNKTFKIPAEDRGRNLSVSLGVVYKFKWN